MPEALIPADSRLILSRNRGRNRSRSTSQQHALPFFNFYITRPYRGYRCLLHNCVSLYKLQRQVLRGYYPLIKGLYLGWAEACLCAG